MYLPKTEIYNLLKTLPYFVSQTNPGIFKDLPAITFEILNNAINSDLDKNIAWQNIAVKIDIWANDSITASNILSEVACLMLENGYILRFSNDAPSPDKSLSHITNRFETIK